LEFDPTWIEVRVNGNAARGTLEKMRRAAMH
jgi:hypothetical protein